MHTVWIFYGHTTTVEVIKIFIKANNKMDIYTRNTCSHDSLWKNEGSGSILSIFHKLNHPPPIQSNLSWYQSLLINHNVHELVKVFDL